MSDFIKEGEYPYLKFIDTRGLPCDVIKRFEYYNCPIVTHNGILYAGPFKNCAEAFKMKVKYSRASNRITEVVSMPKIDQHV